jgi:rhomboid protease GluP
LVFLNLLGFGVEAWLTGGTRALLPGPPAEVLLALGANHALAVWEGELWRLLASAFLHANALHLAINMYALWVLGRLCEQAVGSWRVIALYLGGALVGSATSVAFSGGVSVGASGAIFGFAGALLAYTYLARERGQARGMARVLLYTVGINLALGWGINASSSSVQIDNHAHVGGLAAGAALGLGMMASRAARTLRWTTALGYAAYALLATLTLGYARNPPQTAVLHATAGLQALQAGRGDEAVRRADLALSHSATSPLGLALRTLVCLDKADVSCASTALDKLMELDPLPVGRAPQAVDEPELTRALLLVGDVALRTQSWDLAAQVLGRASQLLPAEPSVLNNHAWALLCSGDLDDDQRAHALAAADRARRLARGLVPSINHTYAEALHRTGRTDQAVEILQGVAAQAPSGIRAALGLSDGVDRSFVDREVARMRSGKPLHCGPPDEA